MNSSFRFSSDTEIAAAADLIRHGHLVVVPTETVYGLAADATNAEAVAKIFEVKGRPSNNPLIVHVGSIDDIFRYSDITRSFDPKLVESRIRALAPLWPGPLSVILPKGREIADTVCAGGDSVALRIPRHSVTLRLIELCQRPLAAPSANPSMYISPTTSRHARDMLGNQVPCILEGGPCTVGLESTVLSLLDETPIILRPGAITAEEISSLLACEVSITSHTSAGSSPALLLSPGLLAKHYAPRTPVVLLPELKSITPLPKKIGVIMFSDNTLPCPAEVVERLSHTGDVEQIAAKLFAALHSLDDMGLDLIVVDTCEPIGLGAAIMDRLIRASHRA